MEDGVGLFVSPAADDAAIEADHITVVDEFTNPALEVKQFSPTAGDGTIAVSNSIFNGFGDGYEIESAGGTGALHIEARYSNLPLTGTAIGGTQDFGAGDISADPLFREDLSLSSASPSIDAGDPAAGGLATDFLGAPRPNDGDGDGAAVRDQGAFEYQRPNTGGGGGGGNDGGGEFVVDRLADTFIVSGPGKKLAQGRARFSFRSDLANPRFQCKLDRGKVRPCRSPKLYKSLKPGRHVFKVWAIAGFGKDPSPAKKRFRVPAKFSGR